MSRDGHGRKAGLVRVLLGSGGGSGLARRVELLPAPLGLGIPLALASLLVFTEGDGTQERSPARSRLAVFPLLFVALSIGHIVLFITVVPAVYAVEAVWVWHARRSLRDEVAVGASAAVTTAGAMALAGFLRVPAWGASAPFTFDFGVVPGLSSAAVWHAQSFGLLLPVGLIGVSLLGGRARAVVAILAIGSLAVLSTLHYRYSGDTVKFGVVAAMALGLGCAAMTDAILTFGATSLPWWRRCAAVALVGSVCSGGWGFVAAFGLHAEDAARIFAPHVPLLADEDERVAAFLRARIKAGEIVYRREESATAYALWAGLPVGWVAWGVQGFGFPRAWLDARRALLRALPAEPERYRSEGIVWFVLGPLDAQMSENVDQWIGAGAAAEVATFGSLRVAKLR